VRGRVLALAAAVLIISIGFATASSPGAPPAALAARAQAVELMSAP
jgi:hypothetical protein